ncbi:MAG: nucleoside triphosphate pyrophosphohydrolase [Candidatus Omnitrophica bacterium 4484_49]|nr:nucleoside triphosphate pyrophosphohydrolase [Candidatus Omnitrophota bacterium]OQX83981.1 MAG: nucleoside triphosphate pyrophosphohydrolase [Candidatus Omnitrophica bacterium 4484_49]
MEAKELQNVWKLVKKLRGPEGCPWDKEQNHHSLLPYLIEEVYEVASAVEKGDVEDLKEELGDLLFMVFSYISIAEEKELFRLKEVIDAINHKMIVRHPHVFGDKDLKTSQDVVNHWHKIKDEERKKKKKSIMDNIPCNISALIRAKLVQERASRVGFDWKKAQDAFLKVKEEIKEIEQLLYKSQSREKLQEEIGDLLFAVVNVARLLNIDSEIALRETIEKFIQRFKYIEGKIAEQNKSLHEVTLEEMESLWEESKRI